MYFCLSRLPAADENPLEVLGVSCLRDISVRYIINPKEEVKQANKDTKQNQVKANRWLWKIYLEAKLFMTFSSASSSSLDC